MTMKILKDFNPDTSGEYPIYMINNPHQLTQIAGYYRYSAHNGGQIYYRGTVKLHEEALPGLFRKNLDPRTTDNFQIRQAELEKYIRQLSGRECACAEHLRTNSTLGFSKSHKCTGKIERKADGSSLMSGTHRAAIEPLLQHYGLRTRWLDVVDNIWVALWFAVNEYVGERDKVASGRDPVRTYAYHLRRSRTEPAQKIPLHANGEVLEDGTPRRHQLLDQESESALSGRMKTAQEAHRSESADELFAYANIYLHETGELSATPVPGYHLSDSCRVIDLRYSVPSLYLRPHAQHGVLIARRRQPAPSSNLQTEDYSVTHTVAAVLRVRLEDALDWLGDGMLANHHSLFPPAAADEGYRHLLAAPMPPSLLGSVTVYQGGA